MIVIIALLAFGVGIAVATAGNLRIEQGSDGNSITHVHLHVGLINIASPRYDDHSHADGYYGSDAQPPLADSDSDTAIA